MFLIIFPVPFPPGLLPGLLLLLLCRAGRQRGVQGVIHTEGLVERLEGVRELLLKSSEAGVCEFVVLLWESGICRGERTRFRPELRISSPLDQ